MGEKSCIHILLGTYSRFAALVNVSLLLSCDFRVSSFSHDSFSTFIHVRIHKSLQFVPLQTRTMFLCI